MQRNSFSSRARATLINARATRLFFPIGSAIEFFFFTLSRPAEQRRELLSTEIRQRGATMRRAGAQAPIHRGGSQEGRRAYHGQSHGTTARAQSTRNYRPRGKGSPRSS